MSISRQEVWKDIVGPHEHLALFLKLDEALEGFLGPFGTSAHKTYSISGERGSLQRQSRAQVSDALSLGGAVDSITAQYIEPSDLLSTSRSVSLTATTYIGREGVSCLLLVNGYDEHETNGWFETLRNRISADIVREFPKSGAVQMKNLSQTVNQSRSIQNPSNRFIRTWRSVAQHPTGSTIVGGLVVAAVLALFHLL